MPGGLTAFVDESGKPLRSRATGAVVPGRHVFALAAVVVLSEEVPDLRRDLRTFGASVTGGRPLRWKGLSAARREGVVAEFAQVAWDGVISTPGLPVDLDRSERRTRHHCLTGLLDKLADEGVSDVVIEGRNPPGSGSLDQRDLAALDRLRDQDARFRRVHLTHSDKSEPMLWLADALVGAWTDQESAADLRWYPRLAHNVKWTLRLDQAP